MAESQRFPLDFDSLGKGDTIAAETITGIIGVPPTSNLYSGKQMELCARIEEELGERGRNVTAVCDLAEIRILTDPEAAKHLRKRFRKRLKGLGRDYLQTMQVDAGQLGPDERAEYDRGLLIQGVILSAIAAAKKELPFVPCRRTTPGLPEPEHAGG